MKCVHVYWISDLKEGQLIEKSEYFIWDESRQDVCDIASVQCISMVQFTSSDQWNQSTVLETQTLGAYPSPWGGSSQPPWMQTPPAHVTCDACWQATHHCEQNDWQTPVKILPCPKLRLRAVINDKVTYSSTLWAASDSAHVEAGLCGCP